MHFSLSFITTREKKGGLFFGGGGGVCVGEEGRLSLTWHFTHSGFE